MKEEEHKHSNYLLIGVYKILLVSPQRGLIYIAA